MSRPFASSVVLAAFLFALVGCASVGRDDARFPVGLPSEPARVDGPKVISTAAPVAPERVHSSDPAPAAFSDFAWPEGTAFRSAGRLRALGLQGGGGVNPLAEQAQLRAHFRAVLAWLDTHEAESIATARARIEAARGAAFSEEERRTVESDLRMARDRQLDVLERYARHGEFPLHPVPGASPAPIFVDAAGTACAVGHLMRVDGWEREVAAIRASNNGVYVPDRESGPVLAWVATSGLLVEEAAVIQPAYTPPPAPGNVDLTALATPGASATASGLRIERFSAVRTQLIEGVGVVPVALDDIRLHANQFYTDGNGGLIEGRFEGPSGSRSPFLFWNAGDAGGFLDVAADSASSVMTEIRFDVSPTMPGYGIDAAYFEVAGSSFWSGAGSSGTELLVEMEVRSRSGELLASFSSESGSASGFAPFDETAYFAPQEGVSVLVRGSVPVYAATDAFWGQFRQDFQIVPIPEPSVALLFALGLGGLAARRSRSSIDGVMRGASARSIATPHLTPDD